MLGVKNLGLTEVIRISKAAWFMDPDTVIGLHESNRMWHGKRVIEPYENRVRLVRCDDGQWRKTHSTSAVRNTAGRTDLISTDPHQTSAPEIDPASFERENK